MTRKALLAAVSAVTVCMAAFPSHAQNNKRSLIRGSIDDSRTVTIPGNVRPEVSTANDLGARADSTPIEGLHLVLHRSPESQSAFEGYLSTLNTPGSANFHKFLTNAQIGQQFGPSAEDVSRIKQWLGSNGFTAGEVSPDGTVLEFSGSVGAVRKAFRAPIHNLKVNGEERFANVKNPEIPEALTPVVSGIASLNNFRPHTMSHLRKAATVHPIRQGNAGGGEQYLTAADLATIYNFTPLLKSGITGRGQTIVLIEDTDQYSIADWQVFRKAFGLSRAYPYGSLTNVHPTGTNVCTAPGTNGDDGEAALDADWATAAAPQRHPDQCSLRGHRAVRWLSCLEQPAAAGDSTVGGQHQLWRVRGAAWRHGECLHQQSVRHGRG